KMGGVVPEVAARAHVKNILPVTKLSLATCHLSLSNVDYIAVTQGPGLIPSLIVGVEFAKALSLATGKPIIPDNHMLGHLYSPFGGKSLASPEQATASRRQVSGKSGTGSGLSSAWADLFPIISL